MPDGRTLQGRMPRIAFQPFAQAVAATVFAFITLAAMVRVGAGHDAAETLPPFAHADGRVGHVDGSSDSTALVRAADDALQGWSTVALPMHVTEYRRERGATVVSLRPTGVPADVTVPRVGGSVRILADGRRVVLRRE